MSALGRRPVDVAKAVEIGEPYLSQLISGEKRNPSAVLLFEISEVLGLSVNDLYRPPPAPGTTRALEGLSPGQMAVLGQLLDNMKNQGRK